MMTLDEALTQRGPRVAAWDRGGDGNTLLVVSVGANHATVISRETVAQERRSAIEQQLTQHGIPIGATYRACDFVWVCTKAYLVVVQLDTGITLQAHETELWLPGCYSLEDIDIGADFPPEGKRVEFTEIVAIQSFVDHADIGHRGVQVVLKNGDVFTFAEERDPMPGVDPAYGRTNLELDAGWIALLGRDLAAQLGVAYRDGLWGREVPPRADKQVDDAATDALVDGLIDAYLRWDEPDRAARREAREAAISKRDKAILGLAYIESGQRGDAPMDVAVFTMAAYFAGRVEREVPGAGTFTPIRQPLPEIENGGYVALEIKPAAGGDRTLELRVESADGKRVEGELLLTDSTAGIVRYLRDAAVAEQLVPIMERLTAATTRARR